MKYAVEMNQIQDAMIIATSLFRDRIKEIFSNHEERDSLVDDTLKKLFRYFSERSQTIAHLTSFEYAWDAEMILRSAFEASAKIWLICLSSQEKRESLVEDFWNLNTEIHNRKTARKANISINLFAAVDSRDNIDILSHLEDQTIFPHDNVNKKERKAAEQKWSFSEIITHLESSYPPEFPCKYISSLLHGYGMASHLIHADESALDLMLDRELREEEELLILKCAHSIRIWNDLVSLWYISMLALHYRYGIAIKREDVHGVYERFCGLCKPAQERFHLSQRDFYKNWKKSNGC